MTDDIGLQTQNAMLKKENKILRLKLRRGEEEFKAKYRKMLLDRFAMEQSRRIVEETLA